MHKVLEVDEFNPVSYRCADCGQRMGQQQLNGMIQQMINGVMVYG